jgi:hypothetical protein
LICAGDLIGNFWPWSFDLSDRNSEKNQGNKKIIRMCITRISLDLKKGHEYDEQGLILMSVNVNELYLK